METISMNPFFIFILAILIFSFLFDLLIELLNINNIQTSVPREFKGVYDPGKYRKSQEYLRANTSFGLLHAGFNLAVLLAFILLKGFNILDLIVRKYNLNDTVTGLIYTGVIVLAVFLLDIPFSAWHTFKLEQRFGFNRTTVKTFIIDLVKTLLLGCLVGGGLLWIVLRFFGSAGPKAWVWVWLIVTVLQFILAFIAPVVIMPLFNKFSPLKKGVLKSAIERYASSQKFRIKGVFTMDGSKRSSRSNAFFTGFGASRRIVLFDTLIKKHSVPELVSVLAHEIGHYKKGHILRGLVFSTAVNGLMFFLLSLFLNNQGLFNAFGMQHISIYAGIIFFGFIFQPLSMILSIITNIISRQNEYEADRFAVKTTANPGFFVKALKKLSVDNLSNLTPHPLKVFCEYSHPPVLQRIAAIQAVGKRRRR
jgi:STE24 endopeptidase